MKNHKYQSTGYTTLDNLMNPFWIKTASYLPYAYTPNMVTVTGLFCQFLSIIYIAFHDLTFSQQLPGYVYIFCAFMLFMAQTLDAIDGKHARNTKRYSSLGQLMDHGCDSMNNFLYCFISSLFIRKFNSYSMAPNFNTNTILYIYFRRTFCRNIKNTNK